MSFNECPICNQNSLVFLGKIKFNNPDINDIEYQYCTHCQFCFSPEMYLWSFEKFEQYIYHDYKLIDVEYESIRPRYHTNRLQQALLNLPISTFRHLDYGGGNGCLSNNLKELGWNSISYDPFVNKDIDINNIGKFELITSFEVFEHVTNPIQLMENIKNLLTEDGMIIFSTLISDNNIEINQPINWWYLMPHAGHISLYSKQSLKLLAERFGFLYNNYCNDSHIFYTEKTRWKIQY